MRYVNTLCAPDEEYVNVQAYLLIFSTEQSPSWEANQF
jgi:hypothetical protein